MLTPRERTLLRLRRTVRSGRPILGAGSSAGIIAKYSEMGGADLIILYSTGRSRLMGLPTSRIGDANALTLDMCAEIMQVIKETPVIVGLDATDPARLRLELLLEPYLHLGVSGVINFPTIGIMGTYRKTRDNVQMGWEREVEFIRFARRQGLFTMAYVFSAQDGLDMAQAGCDCLVGHVGPTIGGIQGNKYLGTREDAFLHLGEMLTPALEYRPDIICLAHGGPLAEPSDTLDLYESTPAVGFIGASSVERIPLEDAILNVTRRFKDVRLPARSGR